LENAFPPIGAIVVKARDWGLAGAKAGRGRVSDRGRKIFEDASNAGVGEAGVPQPNLKGLDCIRNRAGV
jgi:hypothetical protein